MARARTESAQQIAELLRTAREALGLSLAFMTRMDETTQHLEVVESAMPLLFRDGTTRPRANSFCQSIMDGKLPAVIPDVGAGFSSLRHIVLTQPDVIKLDRSIVAGVDADPVLRVLARSLVDLAAACGAAVVAEGVETEADSLALAGLGVHYGQGWFFGRPGAPSALRPSYELRQPILDAPTATSSNHRVSSPTP
ncbi:EAL domain-containing protein [Dactylosporangium sp. NBC_01737]|uniref:EAL domain-containing protein n=1 Tax=Dactylosporangium sp. NBC_01737 TaxID=2975959 RepID=UPI002E0F31E7|nr:EAL domain-containing protein [Dactylosporangium sp. NBC_01737]